MLLYFAANSAGYVGRLGKARELSRQAEAAAALREARFGNAAVAQRRATASLKVSNGRDAQ